MIQHIASKVMEENGFVVFHVDGDMKWSERAQSENFEKFEKKIRGKVQEYISYRLAQSGKTGDVDSRILRLQLMMPFYSIESWLYQNTSTAIRICREKYQGKDIKQYKEWEKDPSLLDEVEKVKGVVCLKSRHNRELATEGFPANKVYAVRKSFWQTVEKLGSCDDFRSALAQTYEK